MEDLTTGNPTQTATGNPSSEPSVSANGTSQSGGEARQGATTETFIPQGVDINTLPPEVRKVVEKINNDMVRGFTEKTTKLSETTKSAESWKQKADLYEQIAGQEEFVKRWNQYVQEVNSKGVQQEANGANGANGVGDPKVIQLEKQIEEIKQDRMRQELHEITEAFSQAVDEKGEKLNPDFDNLNGLLLGSIDMGQGAEEFSLLRACIELSGGKTPQERLALGYKSAKAFFDAIFEEGRKAGLARMHSKVQNSTQPPSNSGTSNLSTTEKRPKSAHEAIEMARKGIVVSR